LFGCLGALLLACLVCGVGGYVLYLKSQEVIDRVKSAAADAARKTLAEEINKSELPQEQKREMIAQVDRVANGFKAGDITLEDLVKILNALAESPVVVVLAVYTVEQKYIVPSGLTHEEKEEARLTTQRIARGAFEERIPKQDIQRALRPVSETNAEGEWQLKESVTDQELRDSLAQCRRIADEAGVPEEPFEVDLGKEFKKAVDQALAK